MIEIKGNGTIVSKEIQVSSFLRLHISAKGLTEVYQSEEEKVVIECDENLLDYFEAVNSGRTLFITSESKFRKPVFTKCLIKVYLRQLNTLYIRCDQGDVVFPEAIDVLTPIEIKIQSVGNSSLNINGTSIKLLSQCQGNVTIKGKCQRIDIKNMSAGDLSTKELIADELTIKNMAEGNVELYADKEISISHYGEGYVYYFGNAVLKDVKQYGEGKIKRMLQNV